MKLVRFGPHGQERPGILDQAGLIRDLSTEVEDWLPEVLGRDRLAAVASLDLNRFPIVEASVRLGVPVSGVRKFIAIGLNYTDHALEANLPIPQEPVIFFKAITSLSGPTDNVMLPRGSTKSDWEVELGVVMGSYARYVSEAEALSLVAGYCLVNDVSEREYQLERGGTWDKGKGCDTFGPVGPWLVTADELGDPQNVDLWLDVNGTRRQTGSTSKMIFGISKIIAYTSQFMALEPGDIITTGTPPGVGAGHKPKPVYLRSGDVMSLGSSALGEQRQKIVAWEKKGLDVGGGSHPAD